MIVPVILCGGSGTRLWPLSREQFPKQFLPLVGEFTLLQLTVKRLNNRLSDCKPIILCNEEHRFLVAEQLREIECQAEKIILEPIGRGTAPAAAIAALASQEISDDAVLLILPADHLVNDISSFEHAVEIGSEASETGQLVTFGIVPDRPESGFGYIKAPGSINGEQKAYEVSEFVEKPDQETAKHFVDSGDYLWNSGMFMFKSSVYLTELSKFNPEINSACQTAYGGAKTDLDFIRLLRSAFETCPTDSIDYAVFEKTDKAVVIPMAAGWSDVGSWATLHGLGDADEHGNVTLGDVHMQDTHGSYLRAEHRMLATVGVHDSVIVETADAVLVADKNQVQQVKKLVEHLKVLNRDEPLIHRRVYRPWGWYESITEDARFQVKRIMIKPGESISLQMHHHRAEHWVIVKGTASVTRGEEEFLLTEDQSTYIPIGMRHRLHNPGNVALELIEVQSGSYLGEDDIVRFEDRYGRIED